MAIYCNTLEGNMQYGDDPYCFTPNIKYTLIRFFEKWYLLLLASLISEVLDSLSADRCTLSKLPHTYFNLRALAIKR